MPELAPANGSIVYLFPPIDQRMAAGDWDDKTTKILSDSTVAMFSKQYDMDIVAQRVLSPRHYQDHMHLYHGAAYGLSPAADPRAQFPHQTAISGLYHAGQTTFPGCGVGPAAMSGVFAAEALMNAVAVNKRSA